MSIRPHRWVDNKRIYLTTAEIKAAKLDDAACTKRKMAEAAQPKPLTLQDQLDALKSELATMNAGRTPGTS